MKLSQNVKKTNQKSEKIPSLTELINDMPDDLKDVPYKMMEDNLFQVFKNGKIFRLSKTNKVECNIHKSNNYSVVSGFVDGKQKHFYVHRLLAKAFIPNPDNKNRVVFKDNNPENLSLDNLMWTTPKEFIEVLRKRDKLFYGFDCKICNKKRTRKKDRICSSCIKEIESKKNKKKNKKKRIKKKADSVKYLLDNIEFLTIKQAEAVKLRGEGLTLEEIAGRLGKSRQAVEQLIRSAYKRVNRLLKSNSDNKLIVLRNKNKLTQNDVAELIGITETSYGNKERGTATFDLPEAFALAELFETSVDELFE